MCLPGNPCNPYPIHSSTVLPRGTRRYKARCGDQSNVADLRKQAFYRHTHKRYAEHLLLHFGLVYTIGGFAGVCWRLFFTSLLYHVTWFVNSAAHLWGKQEYRTGDQSRNNWWVGFLAFGEGWHNNHHAFEYSVWPNPNPNPDPNQPSCIRVRGMAAPSEPTLSSFAIHPRRCRTTLHRLR